MIVKILFLFVLLTLGVQSASTQDRISFGPRVSFHRFDQLGSITGWDMGIGGHVLIPVNRLNVQVSGNYYFMGTPEGFSYDWDLFDFNADLLYSFSNPSIKPYFGGGLTVSRFVADCKQTDFCDPVSISDSSSSFGVVGGLRFSSQMPMWFIESRYVFHMKFEDGHDDRFIVFLGVLF